MTLHSLSLIAGSILAFSVLVSCRQVSAGAYAETACVAGVSRPSQAEMRLCGSITGPLIDEAIRELDRNVRVVTVTSAGGSGVDAIRLAEAMQAQDLTLQVQGICASACAHFLFLPAKHAVVQTGSVVLFHHTDFAIFGVAIRAGLEASQESLARAERQRRFYETRDLPVTMLTDPLARIRPLCVGRLPDQRLYVATGLRTYLPSREVIDSLRPSPVEGYWPRSGAEAGPIAERFSSEAVPLVYGGTEDLLDMAEFPPLAQCATNSKDPGN